MKRARLFSVMIAVFLFISAIGCLGRTTTSRGTVCDDIQGESILCGIAASSGTRLEDVGNGLIVINAVAIAEGAYTKDDARKVLNKLLEALDEPLTYVVFKEQIVRYTEAYPGLVEVAMVYLDQFSMESQMYDADKDILKEWLQARVDSLQ